MVHPVQALFHIHSLLFLTLYSVHLFDVSEAADSHDGTVAAGAAGKDVVESTVDRILASCIFPEDKLFLRRLAYVESNDGMNPKTYRPDYSGGIWQVGPTGCALKSITDIIRQIKH